MHPGHHQPIGRGHVHDAFPGRDRGGPIDIEAHPGFRPRELHARHVDDVTPDQQCFIAGRDQPSGMTWGMPRLGENGNAGERFAGGEQTGPIRIGGDRGTGELNKAAILIGGGCGQGRVIFPEAVIGLMDDQLSIGKHRGADAVDETSDVVGMQVGAEHRFDVGGLDAHRCQVFDEMPRGRADHAAKA